MALKTLLSCLFVGFGLCQSMTPLCAVSTHTGPTLTVQFTPSMPTQIPPTSTVYGAIMTSYLNVVDCDYVMVENIDDNPAQTGSYFYKTTKPVLTVYRVGCMPETTAITRRAFRGYDLVEETPQTIRPASISPLHKRIEDASTVADTISRVASEALGGIDPNNDNLTVEAYRYLVQINSAIFAINLVNSGLPLNRTCNELRSAEVALNLMESSIDPKQAADIVCYASVNGLFFNRTNSELLSDLAALQYAIQVAGGFTTDLARICETLDLSIAPFLNIDSNGIRNLVCGAANTTTTTANTSSPTSAPNATSAGNGTTSNSGTILASTATGLNMTYFPNSTTASTTSQTPSSNATTVGNSISPQPTAFNSSVPSNSSIQSSMSNLNVTTVANNSSVSLTAGPTAPAVTGGTAGTGIGSATSAAGEPGPFANSTSSVPNLQNSTTESTATSIVESQGSLTNSANQTKATTGTAIGTVGTALTSVSPGLNITKEVSNAPPTPTPIFYYSAWKTSRKPARKPR